jgi:hypothetical protein
MLRNLGELIVACYLPDQYARILESMSPTKATGTEVCERLLNFRFEDLGKTIARYWNLPDTVSFCMETPDLEASQSDAERLRIISAFSHALSNVMYRTDRAQRQDALKGLLKTYGVAVPVKENDLPAILDAAVFETEDTFRAARLPLDHGSLASRILAISSAGARVAPAEEDLPAPVDSGVLASLMRELTSMLDSDEGFDLNAVMMMILEAIYRGARLDRALFCLVSGDHTQMEARLGVGADVEPLLAKFRFPVSIRSGPIGIALLKREDLIVGAGTGKRYGRSPFMNVIGADYFGILPLIVDNVVVGCLYFDSASEGFALDAATYQALLELRKLAVMAIARKRQVPR